MIWLIIIIIYHMTGYIDVRDEMCWWLLKDVGGIFKMLVSSLTIFSPTSTIILHKRRAPTLSHQHHGHHMTRKSWKKLLKFPTFSAKFRFLELNFEYWYHISDMALIQPRFFLNSVPEKSRCWAVIVLTIDLAKYRLMIEFLLVY